MGKLVFISFDRLKERLSYEDVIDALQLDVRQDKPGHWRGQCPVCQGGARSLVITEGEGFTCNTAKAAGKPKAQGDQIELAAHVRGTETYAAAKWLVQAFTLDVDSLNGKAPAPKPTKELPEPKGTGHTPKEKKLGQPKPESCPGPERDTAFKPEETAKKLNYDCEDVQSLAPYLTPEQAERLVIGKAPSGMHRGRVVLLVRDHTGEPLFFVSAKDWKFPPRVSF